ncbi:MAG: PBSX family phage terminase large subunit [Geobacteraceae bacterium]|nr:PBSX family phage terminase large subunit [Geobacteraceae bacterium]
MTIRRPPKTAARFIFNTAAFNSAYLPLIFAAAGLAGDQPGSEAWLKRFCLMYGGRGSGKSRAAAQAVVILMLSGRYRVALVRKVLDSIRDSQYQEIIDVITDWGLEKYFAWTSNPMKITCTKTKSTCIAKGFDKAEKIKSLASIDFVWVEEITELTRNDWNQLRFTIRGKGAKGRSRQLLGTFNPINPEHWIKAEFFDDNDNVLDPESTTALHTTYQDNGFLDEAFIRDLERLKKTDKDLYRIITLGLWTKIKGLIFPACEKITEFPALPSHYYGLDFGFSESSPAALVKVGAVVTQDGRNLYCDEKLYMPNLSPSELIEQLRRVIPENEKHIPIYCDDARPETIKEMRKAGFNAIAWKKGASSVYEGIQLTKTFKIHITETSVNFWREVNLYKWREDSRGNQLPEPVKANDHCPDAVRGVVYTAMAYMTTERTGKETAVQQYHQSVLL